MMWAHGTGLKGTVEEGPGVSIDRGSLMNPASLALGAVHSLWSGVCGLGLGPLPSPLPVGSALPSWTCGRVCAGSV